MGNLFSWGGKGGSDAPPMPMMPQQQAAHEPDYMTMMAMMMEGMGGMASSFSEAASQPQMPALPAVPTVFRAPIIDWTEKQGQLNQKMKADYNVDQTRRKNRTDTILTSPLLDEEDATTTGSVLSGSGAGVGNQ